MTTATASRPPARQHHHTSTLAASRGIAVRSIRNIRRLPSAVIPALLMPLFQLLAFSGAFAGVTDIPGFPTDESVNWYLPLAAIMGSAFAGIGIGFTTIRDLESGFYDRLRMSPAPRRSLIAGLLLSAWARSLISLILVVLVGFLMGLQVPGGVLAFVTLTIAGLGMSTIGVGWGLGLAYRFGDMRAAAIMQLTLFLGIFLTDAQTPIYLMEGWLHTVASINPLTDILRLARVGFIEDVTWAACWGGLLAIVVIGGLALLFARRSLASLDD